jgi:pimeloyl-ACP methyl ester carboxylesterase
MNEWQFSLTVGAEQLTGDILSPAAGAQALFLHGAGYSHRQRQRLLREELVQHGVGSAAFDFSGHGDSSANQPGSLQKRLQQAQQVLQHLSHDGLQLDTLVATSMSGEIAIRLAHATANRIAHMVLMVGAIYNRTAFTLPFGPDFSAAIRQPYSWREAETLEMIADYRGGLTLIRTLEDAVIPFEVADLLAQAARNALFVRRIDIPGVDHRLSEKMAQDQGLRQHIANAILAPVE